MFYARKSTARGSNGNAVLSAHAPATWRQLAPDEAHSLLGYQSPWHQTPPRGCLKLLHSYEPQDGNEGDKHEVVHVPAVHARHNCPHEGHCTAIQRSRNGKVIHQTQIQRVAGECALEKRHGANSTASAMCETALFFLAHTNSLTTRHEPAAEKLLDAPATPLSRGTEMPAPGTSGRSFLWLF